MRLKVYDVFTDRLFSGNPTGIVYWDDDIDRERMQVLARELNLPDTMFIYHISKTPGVLFESLTFSPYEELAICGQGMVGAFNAVHEDKELPEGQYTIGTAAGKRNVWWKNEMASVSIGKPFFTEPPVTDVADRIGVRSIGRMGIVDLSRKRLVMEIELEEMAQVQLPPEKALELCRALDVNGLVFFARTDTGLVRSRHFTTSLKGGEDAVTGGAAAAILGFINHSGTPLEELQVYQGDFATRGGHLFASLDKESDEVYVGGHVRKFSSGTLFLDN